MRVMQALGTKLPSIALHKAPDKVYSVPSEVHKKKSISPILAGLGPSQGGTKTR